MKPDDLGNPEVSYECRHCPTCNAINWCMGRTECYEDIHATKCWKCRTRFYIDGYAEELWDDTDDISIICDGVVDPNFPADTLQILVDAAEEQMEDLKMRVRSADDDPGIVEMIHEIEGAIADVKTMLAEGIPPKYIAPRF
jgi:hypothetical protein